MGWDKESLLTKAKVFFDKAQNEDQEDIFFGLYCTMGVELLARAVVSSIHPALLAEPTKDQSYLLSVFGLSTSSETKKSISASQVLQLCRKILSSMTEDNYKVVSAMINRRNEELHTGSAAFKEYETGKWISEFYRFCKVASEHLGQDLEFLFGKKQADAAIQLIEEVDKKVIKDVKDKISAFTKVFYAKSEEERSDLASKAEDNSKILSHKGHHKVVCPSCKSTATISGREFGKENIEHTEYDIVVRNTVMPTGFECIACGLKLNGYGELNVANICNNYTNTKHYAPEDYYELIDPNNHDAMREMMSEYAEDYSYYEYSNE